MRSRTRKVLPFFSGICLSLACATSLQAVEGDNSALNRPENRPTALTADDQGNSAQDVKLSAKIRKAIVSDKSLSTDAHNIKVITRNGKVTLAGAVKDSAEIKTVERIATQIAGTEKVQTQLSVANEQTK